MNFDNLTSTIRVSKSSDRRVVRESASEAIGVIPSLVKPITLKLVVTVSLLEILPYGENVENKPASLLVAEMGIYRDNLSAIIFSDYRYRSK